TPPPCTEQNFLQLGKRLNDFWEECLCRIRSGDHVGLLLVLVLVLVLESNERSRTRTRTRTRTTSAHAAPCASTQRTAQRSRSVADFKLSFSLMLARCTSTVFTLKCRWPAMSRVPLPSPIN